MPLEFHQEVVRVQRPIAPFADLALLDAAQRAEMTIVVKDQRFLPGCPFHGSRIEIELVLRLDRDDLPAAQALPGQLRSPPHP